MGPKQKQKFIFEKDVKIETFPNNEVRIPFSSYLVSMIALNL